MFTFLEEETAFLTLCKLQIRQYECCQKLDDGGHFVHTKTLTKFIAGAKLFTYSNSRWSVVVHIYKLFAVLPISVVAN